MPDTTREALAAFERILNGARGNDERPWFPADVEMVRASLAAPPQPDTATPVPTGWRLVPETLTEPMHQAAVRTIVRCAGNDDWPPRVYRAMLAAAPVSAAPTLSQRLRDAGFTRRPSWRSLPKDGDDEPLAAVPAAPVVQGVAEPSGAYTRAEFLGAVEHLDEQDLSALRAMVEAAYRKAPELRRAKALAAAVPQQEAAAVEPATDREHIRENLPAGDGS